jgi:hypothetical protein
MQHNDERVELARRMYAQWAREGGSGKGEPFPGVPSGDFTPEEFLDRLTAAAFLHHAKLRHPFAARLVEGGWTKAQLREWVRQDYRRILTAIRRHTLLAANATEYETLRGLLARVKAEADVDPVGGTFFALPQLWIKFGIALGLAREEIVSFQPYPEIGLLDDALLADARTATRLPARDLVDASLDPVFGQLWGEALERTLGLARDALDFFRAVAADRWGEETGRAILASRAATRESQAALWNQYRAEAESDLEWDRFSLLEKVLETTAPQGLLGSG